MYCLNRFRTIGFLTLGSLALGGLSSCAEPSSGGAPTTIPQIVVNCTSSACSTSSNPNIHILITAYDCSSSEGVAVASSSMSISCTASAGCYGTTSSWVNSSGAITTIPSGTYTVCGRVDYNHNFASGVTTDDTTSVKLNVTISAASSGPINLTTWNDP
jgi:hypothetical protein